MARGGRPAPGQHDSHHDIRDLKAIQQLAAATPSPRSTAVSPTDGRSSPGVHRRRHRAPRVRALRRGGEGRPARTAAWLDRVEAQLVVAQRHPRRNRRQAATAFAQRRRHQPGAARARCGRDWVVRSVWAGDARFPWREQKRPDPRPMLQPTRPCRGRAASRRRRRDVVDAWERARSSHRTAGRLGGCARRVHRRGFIGGGRAGRVIVGWPGVVAREATAPISAAVRALGAGVARGAAGVRRRGRPAQPARWPTRWPGRYAAPSAGPLQS
jgi:hypothetical protein